MAPAISVLGAGAWGTVLAGLAAANGCQVTLWTRRGEMCKRLNAERTHPALRGVRLHSNIIATDSLGEAAGARTIVLAVPAQAMRQVCEALAAHLQGPVLVVIASKGIEQASGLLMHGVLRESLPVASPLILSGPGFASEVGAGLPAAVTLAAEDKKIGEHVAGIFAGPTFRPYLSDDLIGVAVGGAVKNVLAIGSGVVIGRGLGESARAGLIARGLAELSRFGAALGARRETISGLSGLGDLVLTATSQQSRNFRFGIALGEGQAIGELTAPGAALAEGYFSAPAVVARARREGTDMPIAEAVSAILSGRSTIDGAIASLLDRPLKVE